MTVPSCRDGTLPSGSPQANDRPKGDPSQPVGRRDLPAANCVRAERRTARCRPYKKTTAKRRSFKPLSSHYSMALSSTGSMKMSLVRGASMTVERARTSLPAGTEWVSQTEPPMMQSFPIFVSPPRIVAPA